MTSPGNIMDQTIPPGNTEETQNKMLRLLILPFKWTELIEKEIVNDPDKFFSLIDERRNNGN